MLMQKQTYRWSLLAVLTAGLFFVGCDNNADGDAGDAALFVGTWDAETVTSSGVPGLELIALIGGELKITYQSNTFQLTATEEDGTTAVDISGSYSVDSDAQTVSYTGSDLPEQVDMDYGFQNENDRLELSFDAEALTALGLGSIGDVLPDVSVLGTLKATLNRQ